MTEGACSRHHGGPPPRIVAASSGRALETKQSVAVEWHHKPGGWPREGEDWPCFAPRCVPRVNMGEKGGSVHHPVAPFDHAGKADRAAVRELHQWGGAQAELLAGPVASL